MEDFDKDELDIYINNQEDIIEDELITYLEEKRADKKVRKIHLLTSLQIFLGTTNPFIIIYLYISTNLAIDSALRLLES